jgi:hypothetical protein
MKAIVQSRPLGIEQIWSIILERLGIDTVDSPGPKKIGEIFFKNRKLMRIVSQVFFEMNSYIHNDSRKNRGNLQKFIWRDPVPPAHAPASVYGFPTAQKA